MKTIRTLLISIMLAPFISQAQSVLFPAPNSVHMGDGRFFINGQVEIKAETTEGPVMELAENMRWALFSLPKSDEAGKRVVCLGIDSSLALPDEGYQLIIHSDTTWLRATSFSGLRHAKEVFLQLARFGEGAVDCRVIQDHPRFQWRGFLLDESRHFFGKEKVKQYLDIMASLRLNVFHWHLTDEPGWRIEIKRYPKLAEIGGIGNWHDSDAEARFYTREEIREIVAYAAERGIMVVPEIDMPGHATAACRAYPELSGGGTGFTFHPCKEETFRFLSDVLDEIAGLFPAPFIHVGGDEVHFGNQNWFSDPEIQAFIKANKLVDEKGLEHYFIRRVADIVASKGKTMIGWDEVVDAGVSPEKTVIMWWRHDRKYQLLKALESGYRVVMTPRLPMYGDFVQDYTHHIGREEFNTLMDVYTFPASIWHLTQGYETQILGLQYSMWTEQIADGKRLDYMTFPRLVAAAEAGWTLPRNKNYGRFFNRLHYILKWFDQLGIYYYNPLQPQSRPEPSGPDKEGS